MVIRAPVLVWLPSRFDDDVALVVLKECDLVTDISLIFTPLLAYLFDQLDFVSLLDGADVQDVLAHGVFLASVRYMGGAIVVEELIKFISLKSSNTPWRGG